MTKEACGVRKAPPGWSCSRAIGHEGPCAAWPLLGATGDKVQANELALAYDKLERAGVLIDELERLHAEGHIDAATWSKICVALDAYRCDR